MTQEDVVVYLFLFIVCAVLGYIVYLRTELRISRERNIHLIDDLCWEYTKYDKRDPSLLLKEKGQIKKQLKNPLL